MTRRGRVLCLSGVSGGGKGTVGEVIRRTHSDLAWSVSATTRAPRPGEIDGVHYHFLSDDEFDAIDAEGGFVEWVHIYGHRSGTLKDPLAAAVAHGHDIMLEIEVNGAEFVKRTFGDDSIVVFLVAPSPDVQRERLIGRGTSGDDLERRLSEAAAETAKAEGFADAIVVNDTVDATVTAVERLFFEADPVADSPAHTG